jgi:hypothetical protein
LFRSTNDVLIVVLTVERFSNACSHASVPKTRSPSEYRLSTETSYPAIGSRRMSDSHRPL